MYNDAASFRVTPAVARSGNAANLPRLKNARDPVLVRSSPTPLSRFACPNPVHCSDPWDPWMWGGAHRAPHRPRTA